jgi:diguanylate cyclase
MREPSTSTDAAPLQSDWLLGRDRLQRLRLSQQLLAAALMVACSLILIYAGSLAGADWRWMAAWGSTTVLCQVLIYALIRSGWSMRLADPSLTLVQMVFALLMATLAYPLTGELRAVVMPIMMLVLVFGMFRLQLNVAIAMGWLALAMLGAGMVLAGQMGRHFEPAIEWGYLMMGMVTFPGIAILAGRISRIRQSLTEQRQALNEALARIELLATRDELTGLFNRRHGDALLAQALRRHERSQRPLCVALLDLDHFKRFNDQYGHAVGDLVLRRFAEAASSSLRATDTLARWGGEEFLLLLDDSDAEAAARALQRVHEAVAKAGAAHEGVELTFTFSAGMTQLRLGDTALQLLERADQALYRAKAEGRNRTQSDPL